MSSFVESLNISKTGILFIEYQNDFCKEGGTLYPAVKTVMESNNMLLHSKELLAFARTKGIKVLHAPIVFTDDYRELGNINLYGILANVKASKSFLENGWGGKIIDEMKPIDNDIIIQGKRGLCAFASTNLDFILRQHGIENLIICGYLTNCCVESTMRTAYEKGYKVITLSDCSAATSLEEHDAAIKYTFPMFSIPMTSTELIAKF